MLLSYLSLSARLVLLHQWLTVYRVNTFLHSTFRRLGRNEAMYKSQPLAEKRYLRIDSPIRRRLSTLSPL